jgi:dihydroflavonol-4-reductase
MLVVTGANGFLGSYVVSALLQKGYKVKALRRAGADMSEFNDIIFRQLKNTLPALAGNLTWQEADITDVQSLDDAFAGAEYVFHCAAMISFKGDYEQMLKVNTEGTANVVNACLTAGVKKLVYASSTAALGRTDGNEIITEESQWSDDDNNTEYAKTKHLAELEVWRGIEEGLNAVIVNPGIILGAGNWKKGSCRLFGNVARGLRFYTEGVNGFVGVTDVAEAMIRLAFSEVEAQRFLLISDNLSYKHLFSMMAAHLGKKAPSIELKPAYIRWLKWPVRLYGFLNPQSTITVETLQTSVKQHRYDSSKIRKLIGFEFRPVEEVLKETAAAYKVS